MKKLVSFALCLLVFMSFAGCGAKELPEPKGEAFEAVVKEVTDEGFLVMPVEGSKECGAAMEVGLVVIKTADMPAVKVGDRVRIDYDGVVTRSIPGRLGEVYGVIVID